MIRKIANRSVKYSVKGAKKVLARTPRLRNTLQRVAYTQMGVPTPKQLNYKLWVQREFPDFIAIAKLRKELAGLQYQPKISIVVPTYNTDHEFLRDCLDSVLGQVYENWELCIVDDASTDKDVRDIITVYAADDARIKYTFLKKNKHIAGATNEAIAMASGEFVALFDHDDLLWPNALAEVVKALNKDKKLDFLYTDEDKITEDRHDHFNPFFKPDWNPDFLHSVNYITHLSVVRTTLLRKLGGEKPEYNGAQDWDLILRITSATTKICHIPKVVYSWRVHSESTAKSTDTKPYVVEAQKKALQDDLARRGHKDAIVAQDPKHTGYWRVTYPLKGEPLVSIVIPSKNQYKVVKRCIESIYDKSTYRNFEIVLVDTGSDEPRVHAWYKRLAQAHDNFRVVDWPEQPFSYTRSCNEGARQAEGDILIMLNNDTEVLTPDWIQLLAGEAQRTEVGAVGCLLFFPDKYHIQHAGVGVGLGGVAANSFAMLNPGQMLTQTQHLMINTRHDMTVVTAACLAIRKSVFVDIGGFNEEFRVTYNDVDLCLRLYEKGYQNIYTPYARLIHHESISVGMPEEVAKRDTSEFKAAKDLFLKRWRKYVEHDPNLNPNLSKNDAFYDIPAIQVRKAAD